ncbi:MAG: class I SAM-dependent methyltransferase [Saccharothrix sp.]|nr:class I SAM-dependent methyltransferase [Saccharothrix sp.]
MGIGPTVRQRLGRLEVPAAEFYRNRFINLDDLAVTLASLTGAKRILEIGCGDGSFGQRLCEVFPDADYLGIDIATTAGRLYRGDPRRAAFRSVTSSDLLAEAPEPFDLVCIVDVVHHLPEHLRVPILRDAAALTSDTGTVVVKDWEQGRGVAHAVTFMADRYLSGDKTVRFPTREQLRGYLADGLPGFGIACETRVPPRRNNVLYVMRRDADQ